VFFVGFAWLPSTSGKKSAHAFSKTQRDCRIVADGTHDGFARLINRVENPYAYVADLCAHVLACLIDDGLDMQHLVARDLCGLLKVIGYSFQSVRD